MTTHFKMSFPSEKKRNVLANTVYLTGGWPLSLYKRTGRGQRVITLLSKKDKVETTKKET